MYISVSLSVSGLTCQFPVSVFHMSATQLLSCDDIDSMSWFQRFLVLQVFEDGFYLNAWKKLH